MKRCLSYLKKIRDSDSSTSNRPLSSLGLLLVLDKARVNTEAAQRVIRNALWSRDGKDDNKK